MTDRSEITEEVLHTQGLRIEHQVAVRLIVSLLNKRIDLPEEAYTTMSDTKWLEHFRDALVDYYENNRC